MSVEFIAEFTTNHMGNLNLALEMARKAKEVGVTAIKMQKKEVESFYTQEKLNRLYKSPYGETYRDYRKTFEFDANQFDIFADECLRLEVPWYVTVQDIPSLEWIRDNFKSMWRYKFSSSNLRNHELLVRAYRMLPLETEIVLSTAGATLQDIENALLHFRDFDRVWLLHCVAEYPTKRENLRLGNIPVLKKKFGDDKIKIGYSDHSQELMASWTALYLGAEMIERHFCLSRHSFVHHIDCASTPEEFEHLIHHAEHAGFPAFKPYYDGYLETHGAGKVEFGMTKMEKSFLVDQTYGEDYLGKESKWTS
jgi:N-acetylneuraminate synthase